MKRNASRKKVSWPTSSCLPRVNSQEPKFEISPILTTAAHSARFCSQAGPDSLWYVAAELTTVAWFWTCDCTAGCWSRRQAGVREKAPYCISQAIWGQGPGKEQLQAPLHLSLLYCTWRLRACQRPASGENQDANLPCSEICKQSQAVSSETEPEGTEGKSKSGKGTCQMN